MINYRPAVFPDDLPLLASWNQQLIEDEGHRNPMDLAQLEKRMNRFLSDDGYQATLFSRGAFVVAYALYLEDGDTIHLRQFFVARDCRRRGVGKAAMRVLQESIWPNDKRVTVDALTENHPAMAFWKSCGFGEYAVTFLKETVIDQENT
jgi:predicted acetyltransferase